MESRDGQSPHYADVSAVSALDEPARRRLYDFVRRHREPVGRDEAAAALGLPRTTAAFHLDKLADEGLLSIEFARRSGRSGPGAGRPAKLYRRADRPVVVQLPERNYELAGRLLAGAIDDAESRGESPGTALARRAHELGETIGAELAQAGEPTDEALHDALERCGYEPCTVDDDIALANCPFHALVNDHTELVCGMNLRLIEGLLDGVRCGGRRARLAPEDGFCCVRLGVTDAAGAAERGDSQKPAS
ncbi:helix-turn-helix domain-containing protein [Rhodococcus sp. D2-41]|uniref:helix-turn-helix transcriptional regulator n=1 Tax=Speluncibacter jeojiensis TaxID=2710754 RepID=UPI00240F2B25|nr:helix-turn-helix domain-containing protein [Rhodococcus sp. D2-41]MDG3008543.1 helix-turn-helix domain-containing protein [Rhodococcus sp. D2-41]